MQECLRRMPLAIDSAIALAELGVPYCTIIELCPVMAKANLSRSDGTGSNVASAPRSAEATFYAGTGVRAAPENCARRNSHAGVLFHSPKVEVPPTPVPRQHNSASNEEPSPQCQNTSGTCGAVRWVHPAQPRAADDTLLCREPMIERSLSPTDTWLPSHKEQGLWQAGDILQEAHVQATGQLHSPGILLHAPAQQRRACTRLSLKGGLHAMQQASDAPAALVGTRATKRRKVVAMRVPLLEQEQDAPNSGLVRDASGSAMKRNQPDCDMIPFDSPVEQKPVKAVASCLPTTTPQTQEPTPQFRDQPGNTPVHAVSQVGDAEMRRIQQRPGLGWLGLVVAGHAHLFRAANREAVREFSAATALFPNDVASMLSAAIALLAAGDHVGAISTFQRARVLDPLNVRGMDVYACLLLDQGNHEELRMLSHGLLAVDLEMPEVWAVMAYFWLQKSESDKALEYVERYVLCY